MDKYFRESQIQLLYAMIIIGWFIIYVLQGVVIYKINSALYNFNIIIKNHNRLLRKIMVFEEKKKTELYTE
jgi:hypothetical protein